MIFPCIFLLITPEIREVSLLMTVFASFMLIFSVYTIIFAYLADIVIFENGFKIKYLKHSEIIKFDDIKTTKSIPKGGGIIFITKKNKSLTVPFLLFSNGSKMLNYMLKRIEESSAG